MNSLPNTLVDEAVVKATLRSRADELAKRLDARIEQLRLIEILEFTLGKERYGFPSCVVREVFRLSEITPLPGVPAYVLGVMNVRGRILSVIDIRRLFDFGNAGLTNLNKAIILAKGDMELAVLADEVTGVRNVGVDNWQSTLPTLTERQGDYLLGVTKDQIVMLDAEKLLMSKDLIVGAGV